MTFTMPGLARSLADYLAPFLPGVDFYADPNQQGTAPRALFLRQTNAKITKRMSGRFLRKLGLDLVYLEQLNIVDTESRLQAAADVLDRRLETFPYSGGGDEKPILLRTYERRWEITDSTLHYKFDLQLWLTPDEDAALMMSIETLNMEVV